MRKKYSVGVLGIVLLGFIVACGGESGGGSATKPSATATGVTFGNSIDMLKVGERVGFSATATHSDGTTAAVTDWFSDTPSVATVDASGGVTGVGSGLVNIAARHDGVQAVKNLRVVPDVGGSYSGRYRVSNCTDSGDFATYGWCNEFRGVSAPITIVLSQNRDSVNGSISYGQIGGTVTGLLSVPGSLSLSGTATTGDGSWVIQSWNTTMSGGSMSGTFVVRVTLSGASGSAYMTCELTGLPKGFTVESVAAIGGNVKTMSDLVRAAGIR